MKRAFLGLVVMVLCISTMAQQEYFIFIQETTGKPFYVRMGEESYSSSAGGHLILSRLKDSVYNLYIGFPRSRAAEQLFTITMGRKDHGYELRNQDGRWQLFDLRTQQAVLPVSTVQVNLQEKVRRTDPYSELMANVVDDTAVLYFSADTVTAPPAAYDSMMTNSVEAGGDSVTVGKVDVRKDTSAIAKAEKASGSGKKRGGKRTAKKDSTVVVKEQAATIPDSASVADVEIAKTDTTKMTGVESTAIDRDKVMADTTKVAPPKNMVVNDTTTTVRDKRDIIRISTENVVEGKLMIYVDRTGPANDTIRIIIPRL